MTVALVLLTAGCAGSTVDDDQAGAPQAFVAADSVESVEETAVPEAEDAEAANPRPTEEPDPETALELEVGPPERVDVRALVGLLAADELNGRNNQTQESVLAQDIIVDVLEDLALPAFNVEGRDGYLQPYDVGTNIVGIQPGAGALADEYVMVGAHYDSLARGECSGFDLANDQICNGAADNATGVASALAMAQHAASEFNTAQTDRRGLIIALWDGEEDGLVGSGRYVANPVVPLEQVVAYINFDIQGVSLTPALANLSLVIGAETGGQRLIDATRAATEASPLDYGAFSVIFGQGRSDHARFASAGVPVVFFTDANNGCYHTVKDDVEHVDFDKLAKQLATAAALIVDLLTSATPPVYDAGAPISDFNDAENLLAVMAAGIGDAELLDPLAAERTRLFLAELESIVAAGPDVYDVSVGAVLAGAQRLVNDLANGPCLQP